MSKTQVGLEEVLAAIRALKEIAMAEDDDGDQEDVPGDEPEIRKGIGNVGKRMGKNFDQS